jgi:hypothetical protein
MFLVGHSLLLVDRNTDGNEKLRKVLDDYATPSKNVRNILQRHETFNMTTVVVTKMTMF